MEKMRRILVIDVAASSGGALTVLQDFYKAVCDSAADIEWFFLLSDHYVAEKENIRVIVRPKLKSHIRRLVFDCATGRNLIKKINPDIIFSLQNTTLMGVHVPQVVYVHQGLPFQSTYKFSFIKKNEWYLAVIQYLLGQIIKCSIRRANYVIVQTKWMEKAVISQCRIPKDNIVHIYPTINKAKKENICSYCTTNKFFYPTSNAFYKNIHILLEACRKLDVEDLTYRLKITIDGQGSDKINYTGVISKEEVYRNYQNSCLVFPSYIESFGYPLMEAKACDAIILASDCEFSHELLDDYPNAYFFNPFSAQELYCLMKKVILGEVKRKMYSENNKYNNAGMNSWRNVVQILNILSKNIC